MIEVVLTNGQRFFFDGEEPDLTDPKLAGFPITAYATTNPGETSRVWYIFPEHVVSFSGVKE
jgi:hypothetical protein